MNFDKALHGCFSGSLEFATHASDEDRAFAWLGTLRERKIGFRAALEQVEAYLTAEKARQDHIRGVLEDVTRYIQPWLTD